jgi:hypothetical protein
MYGTTKIIILFGITAWFCAYLLLVASPRQWILKIKDPLTVHHKKIGLVYPWPPFHYMTLFGKSLQAVMWLPIPVILFSYIYSNI